MVEEAGKNQDRYETILISMLHFAFSKSSHIYHFTKHRETYKGSHFKCSWLVLPRPRTRDSVISMLSERIIEIHVLKQG